MIVQEEDIRRIQLVIGRREKKFTEINTKILRNMQNLPLEMYNE
jgi:hypothetical protein